MIYYLLCCCKYLIMINKNKKKEKLFKVFCKKFVKKVLKVFLLHFGSMINNSWKNYFWEALKFLKKHFCLCLGRLSYLSLLPNNIVIF